MLTEIDKANLRRITELKTEFRAMGFCSTEVVSLIQSTMLSSSLDNLNHTLYLIGSTLEAYTKSK